MLDQESALDVLRVTTREIMTDLDPAAFDPGRTLSELGCNSIDRAEIITLSMERLGVAVPVTELHSGLLIADLVALLQKHS